MDIPVLDIVGIPISVPNADESVRNKASIITESYGGKGVLKELVEKILKSQLRYDDTVLLMKKKVFN